MTFAELGLNYNGPSTVEKVFQRAVKKLRENLNAGEYGVWVTANRAIRKAKREAQDRRGYEKPQIGWLEQEN